MKLLPAAPVVQHRHLLLSPPSTRQHCSFPPAPQAHFAVLRGWMVPSKKKSHTAGFIYFSFEVSTGSASIHNITLKAVGVFYSPRYSVP